MFRLPYVPTSKELIDNAFRAGRKEAKKARSTGKRREVRMKQSDFRRVEEASKFIESSLKAVVKNFPSFDALNPFYRSLLNIKVDRNQYKKSLGAVNWCLDKVVELRRRELASIRRDQSSGKEFLGRTSSFVKRISKDLDFLIHVKQVIRSFPTLEDAPTIVVAGFPNVGKSTFVRNLTGSDIEVKHYPFTTKDIMVGHVEVRHVRHQIIDSPGLLDRPMSERNKIELQAIASLEHLANKILFILDPTQDIEPQIRLLGEVSGLFSVGVFVAVNKVDSVPGDRIERIKSLLPSKEVYGFSANNPVECAGVFGWVRGA